HKGSHKATISALCSFLYILGVTRFLLAMKVRKMYKKLTFYTYACTEEYSIFRKMCYNLFELDLIRFIRVNPDEELPRLPMPR
ncbi:hypothetical protein, partial [Priestia megaterium]|uniref:hypothetical protein n=1 Tax=Priestia megaterium TaxID=1404 RepID=UPI001BEA3904